MLDGPPSLDWIRPTLRPHEECALAAWRSSGERGVVYLPAGEMGMRLAMAAMALDARTSLILAPTTATARAWTDILARWYAGPVGFITDDDVQIQTITVAALKVPPVEVSGLVQSFDCVIVDDPISVLSGACASLLESVPARSTLGLSRVEPPHGSATQARIEALIGTAVGRLRLERVDGGPEVLRVRLRAPLDSEERVDYTGAYRSYAAASSQSSGVAEPRTFAVFGRWSHRAAARRALSAWEKARTIAAGAKSKQALALRAFHAHPTERVIAIAISTDDARRLASAADAELVLPDMSRRQCDRVLRAFREGRRLRLVASLPLLAPLPHAHVAIFASPLADAEGTFRPILRSAWGAPPVVYELAAAHTLEDPPSKLDPSSGLGPSVSRWS